MAFRDPDKTFADSADAYRAAAATGKALDYVKRSEFYALARVKGREKEALALGRSLYQSQKNRTPTLKTLLFVLEAFENPSQDLVKRAIEIFGTPQEAYDALSAHWQRTRERFPVYGVAGNLADPRKNPEDSCRREHPETTPASARRP